MATDSGQRLLEDIEVGYVIRSAKEHSQFDLDGWYVNEGQVIAGGVVEDFSDSDESRTIVQNAGRAAFELCATPYVLFGKAMTRFFRVDIDDLLDRF